MLSFRGENVQYNFWFHCGQTTKETQDFVIHIPIKTLNTHHKISYHLPREASLISLSTQNNIHDLANMELAAQSLSLFFCSKASPLPSSSITPFFHSSKSYGTQLQFVGIKSRKQRNFGVVFASEGQTTSTNVVTKWLLQPVGDGDSRHIGFKVERPGPIEIVSDDVIVGRVPDKANVVIPVATVSGIHARIQKQGGSLLVTDLDSTNGTFVDERRLTPGVAYSAPPGSLLTFGDTNLAIFRVSKLGNVEIESKQEELVEKLETEDASERAETE